MNSNQENGRKEKAQSWISSPRADCLACWRWRHRFFSFPGDYLIPDFVMSSLKKLGLEKIAADIYDK